VQLRSALIFVRLAFVPWASAALNLLTGVGALGVLVASYVATEGAWPLISALSILAALAMFVAGVKLQDEFESRPRLAFDDPGPPHTWSLRNTGRDAEFLNVPVSNRPRRSIESAWARSVYANVVRGDRPATPVTRR
jgi:hypothetical protein